MENVPVLLVTANVGSVFEDPDRLLKTWIAEFVAIVKEKRPSFIALHLQEVGGKTYEKSMEYVQDFIKILCEAEELIEFNRIRVYLDEDFSSAENFTALGNLYFVRKTIRDIDIWNFLTHQWDTVEGKNIHTGNIETIATKEKSKFPQHFFPECKWSRKGFLRTRWRIDGTVIDMINIHLFHDASNLAACEEFPSVYCKSRRRALVHTLERFFKDRANENVPFFIFGDFNFRCNTKGVIKKLTEDLTPLRHQNIRHDYTKMHYRDSNGKTVLTIGKKEFKYDYQDKFKDTWLQQFDCELDPLKKILLEYPIKFPPSYPYEEDPQLPYSFMLTRCPAWCDRILMSPTANHLINDKNAATYNIIGKDVCMGDHKPVYLHMNIKTNQGIVTCCCGHEKYSHTLIEHSKCLYCTNQYIKVIESQCLNRKKDNLNFDNNVVIENNRNFNNSVQINVIDTDNNLSVCVCASLYESNENISARNDQMETDGTICPICRNIINRQPVEHRRTLISKRSILPNNIIVNRINTQYLNTYEERFPDPYTPDSIESHSPFHEMIIQNDEFVVQNIGLDSNIRENIKLAGGGVSPTQLKSKLQKLKRCSSDESIDPDTVNSEEPLKEGKNKKSKSLCSRICSLL